MKLNLGAGAHPLPGYLNLDRVPAQGVAQGEVFPLDLPDSCADEIRASHILEHFGEWESLAVLREWVRVLKPGGLLKVAVPDFAQIALKPEKWNRLLMGGQQNENDFHRSVWDRDKLCREMELAGLTVASEPWTDIADCSSLQVSLNVQGVKPLPAAKNPVANGPQPKVPGEALIQIAGVMSLPRLGWNDSWGSIYDALAPFKIPVRRYTGAFWDQCIQQILEGCVSDGLDWALCFDYDSMITAKQLDKLFSIFASRDDIDALAAMQPRRRTGMPLMTVGKPGEMKTDLVIDGSPIKCRTAHFGCTLIRMDRLKDLPKPWFRSVPDAGGQWSEDKTDADMYFWRLWEQEGRTVYVDPGTRIGHLEVLVSEIDEKYQHRYTHPQDWHKREKCRPTSTV